MPCFKGLAVSIHADGPIGEHSIQKQSRASRISSYIAVPAAKVPEKSTTGKPEQSNFAISITLLTPGLNVPYSTPKATDDDPWPRPRVVGGLPGFGSERGKFGPSVPPYIPRTSNPNETIAAYIYFDGRAKEEVATLLRRGEETWVNSRWVSVPESEGGGLAEREFLFREVGLERWLNGLDLDGSKDKAERIERRQKRLEKKRRKKRERDGMSEGEVDGRNEGNDALRYGGEDGTLEGLEQEDGFFTQDSDSEDEPPEPEAAGQIKVALYRVLASGEIKRGEYSPQFDAHDDDEGMGQNGESNGDADVDHTTSFAKPKSLDPKSISTQTVTGLDPPESPYAVFTFFYRGDKQLRKMGILNQGADKTPQIKKEPGADVAKLGPLKSTGTVGYSGYRDSALNKRKGSNKDVDAMDSDDDEDDDERLPNGKNEDDVKVENDELLSVEEARRRGELAEGVGKIKLKRQHSGEPFTDPASTRKSPYLRGATTANAYGEDVSPSGTPRSTSANAGTPPDESTLPATAASPSVNSPYKRQRNSMPGLTGIGGGLFGSLSAATAPEGAAAATMEEQHRAASTPEVKVENADGQPPDGSTSQPLPQTKIEDDDEEL